VVDESFIEDLTRSLAVLAKERKPPSSCSLKNMWERRKVIHEAVGRTIRFVECYGKDHINIVNRQDLDKWLLPYVVPIAALVQAVNGDSIEG